MTNMDDNDSLFDGRQALVFEALRERSLSLAGAYRMAIRLLQTPPVEGDERAGCH